LENVFINSIWSYMETCAICPTVVCKRVHRAAFLCCCNSVCGLVVAIMDDGGDEESTSTDQQSATIHVTKVISDAPGEPYP